MIVRHEGGRIEPVRHLLAAALLITIASFAWWSCRTIEHADVTESSTPRARAHPGVPRRPAPTTRWAASAADLQTLIAQQGSLTFRSWDGQWIGTDVDTDVTFLPAGDVYVVRYGDAVSAHRGTYDMRSDGTVTLKLPPPASAWPALSLRRDARSLLLTPKQGQEEAGSWPFRPVTAADEAAVRRRIAEDADKGSGR
jgi:hypothetical protein